MTHKLVEVTGEAQQRRNGLDISVSRDIHFRSPIDGSVVTTHEKLRQHNEKHNVVEAGAFGPNEGRAYYEQKAKERADVYQGTAHTHYGARLKRERRQDVIEAIRRITDE